MNRELSKYTPEELIAPPDEQKQQPATNIEAIRGPAEQPEQSAAEQEAELRSRLRLLFEDGYLPSESDDDNDGYGHGSFGADKKILDLLGVPLRPDGTYGREQMERTRLFFDELITFVKTARKDPEQRQDLPGYLAAWREAAFSVSPNISNFLSMEDEMIISAQMRAIPELRQSLASEVGGELVYNVQFMRGDRKKFLQRVLQDASIEQKLNLIDQLVTTGTGAVNESYAEEAFVDIKAVMADLMMDDQQSPFVHYAAKVAERQLRDAAFNMHADVYGRKETEERERITQHLLPDDASLAAGHMGQISKDAVAAFNNDATMQEIAFVEAGGFRRDPEAVAPLDAKMILERLPQISKGDGRTTLRVIDWMEQKVFHQTDGGAAHAWEQLATGTDRRLWNAYGQAKEAMDRVLQDWNAFQNQTREEMKAEGATDAEVDEELDGNRYAFDQQLIAPFDRIQSIAEVLSRDPAFFQTISQHLEGVLQKAQVQTVHFDSVDDLGSRADVFPSGGAAGLDTTDLLRAIHRPAMRQELETDLGFSLNALTLREQVQMLGYLADNDNQTTQEAFATIKTFGIDAARTFLSLEHGKESGDAILKIAKEFPSEIATRVFARYTAIADIAEKDAEELVKQFYKDGQGKSADQRLLEQELLKRAKELLVSAANNPSATSEDVLKKLQHFNADNVLFTSIFKTAFKGKDGEVDFETIRGLEFETTPAKELSQADRAMMKTILEANWNKQRPEVVAALLSEFNEKFDQEDLLSDFYLLRREGKIIGFLSFTHNHPDAPDGVYGDSFNVDPDLMSSGIGGAFLERTLDVESQNYPIYAHADASAPVAKAYVEKFGFEPVGQETEELVTGKKVTWLKLRRPQMEGLAKAA